MLIQFISAIIVIIFVLLHSAKGEGFGSIGGSAGMFNSQKGLEEGLNRLTATFAAVFLSSSAILGLIL